MSAIKVLGVGSAILDILARVDDSFISSHAGGEKGGMVMTEEKKLDSMIAEASKHGIPGKAIGGSAGNTIFGLAHLGIPTVLLAKTGSDENGAYYRNRYAAIGGDISAFKKHESLRTGRCLSLITPDAERTMRTDLGAASTLVSGEITESDFDGVTHVHIEGYMLFNMDVFMRVLELAKQKGCTVSLDLASFEVVNIFRDLLPAILRDYVDIVFTNEEEAKAFCGMETFDPFDAAEILSGYCSVVCVKLGKEGALIRAGKNELVRVPAVKVNAVDATGAGDLWHAGFLYGYLRGADLAKCGKMASLTGAEVVSVFGAGIPEERWNVIREKFNDMEK